MDLNWGHVCAWAREIMMKSTFRIALAVAMTTLFVVPAMAQDNFPDVPENHWAFEAIENLKREGILVGYPDG
ncbi:MAG: S-layer homology domain-containing protein, partial [Armatimonadetes bacterium]|nr:S-layer homology domain-containing protein [Armatimonadota bacterium]